MVIKVVVSVVMSVVLVCFWVRVSNFLCIICKFVVGFFGFRKVNRIIIW